MTLKQATEEVIKQNIEVEYRPVRFIEMTKGGEEEDLKEVISGLVLDPEVKGKILEILEKHNGKPVFIEEFIAMYHFNLPKEVIKEAIQRAKEIQESRLFYMLNR